MKSAKKTTTKNVRKTTKRNEMTPALRASCNKIRRLMNTANTNEAETKYAIAVEVRQVRSDKEKYGKESVERLARALGVTATLLYAYDKVAQAWETEREFMLLAKKTNARGVTLTFWHFVAIARAKTNEQREKLLSETLAKSLSAGDVERKLRGSKRKGAEGQQFDFTLSRTAGKVAKLLTLCQSASASPELVAELEDAARDVAAAKKEFDAMMEKVAGRLDAFKNALAAPDSGPHLVNGASATAASAVGA